MVEVFIFFALLIVGSSLWLAPWIDSQKFQQFLFVEPQGPAYFVVGPLFRVSIHMVSRYAEFLADLPHTE
jgi:hypothetical protein